MLTQFDHAARRTGVTLTEVLVAIFIMGIGLLSLLAMFPLGAINMKLAIQDQRTADAARNATVVARLLDFREDQYVFPNYTNVDWNPPVLGGAAPPTTLPLPSTSGPSYPVYVDPVGVSAGSNWTGYLPSVSSGFRRVAPFSMYAPGPTLNPTVVERWTKVLDDMAFDDRGQVKLVPPIGGQPQREPRYSYAFMCRQIRAWGGRSTANAAGRFYDPITPDPATVPGPLFPYTTEFPYSRTPQGVELAVVVYDRRPNFVVGGAPVEEKSYQAIFGWNGSGIQVPNVGVITWQAGAAQPAVRRGTWILDATVTDAVSGPRGYFYRVANVTQLSATTLEIEFQQNVRASTTPTSSFANNNVAVVMESVVEVFDKGTK